PPAAMLTKPTRWKAGRTHIAVEGAQLAVESPDDSEMMFDLDRDWSAQMARTPDGGRVVVTMRQHTTGGDWLSWSFTVATDAFEEGDVASLVVQDVDAPQMKTQHARALLGHLSALRSM